MFYLFAVIFFLCRFIFSNISSSNNVRACFYTLNRFYFTSKKAKMSMFLHKCGEKKNVLKTTLSMLLSILWFCIGLWKINLNPCLFNDWDYFRLKLNFIRLTWLHISRWMLPHLLPIRFHILHLIFVIHFFF